MANIFITLPSQAANGSGAATDVSAMGATKTFTVAGTWPPTMAPTITIEVNNDPTSTNGSWAPVVSFQGAGERTLNIAARWMRATVSGYRQGAAPDVEVGGVDDGTDFGQLVAPAGNGAGAAVDTSALGLFKTIQVGGAFRGSTLIEVSEDGGASWAQIASFQAGGISSRIVAAEFMRVSRSGVPGVSPGLPIINIGACESGGGGGNDGNRQSFAYTVTGLEPDLANLVIPLPAARGDTLYLVQVTQSTSAEFLGSQVPAGGRALGDFVLALTSDATANDVFWFTVQDPT